MNGAQVSAFQANSGIAPAAMATVLGGDVLQQLRPNLALSEATVSRWMSAPVEAPALTVTGAADHDSGWLFSC